LKFFESLVQAKLIRTIMKFIDVSKIVRSGVKAHLNNLDEVF